MEHQEPESNLLESRSNHVIPGNRLAEGEIINHGAKAEILYTHELTNIKDTPVSHNCQVVLGSQLGQRKTENLTLNLKQEPFDLSSHVDVPDVVAAETVVTTTPPRVVTYSADDTITVSPVCVKIFSPDHKTETVLLEQLEEAGVWSQLTACGKLLSVEDTSENELNTSQESFIALAPDTITVPPSEQLEETHNPLVEDIKSERDRVKRERDRAKKQALRLNPSFREKEKEKAKVRMRNKRSDPNYRDDERKKDRIRRRISRQRTARQRKQQPGATDLEYQRILENMSNHGHAPVNVVVEGNPEGAQIHLTEDGQFEGGLTDEMVLQGVDTNTYIVIDSSTRDMLDL